MLFKGIIAVYCENHMKCINTLCGQNTDLLIVTVGGTWSHHCALKVDALYMLIARIILHHSAGVTN
jgi:hypothetical protein